MSDGYPPAPVPDRPTLSRLRDAATECRACDLFKPATQVVVGEGPARARVMLVGEQPGDREDLAGHPFVGPAGRVLDEGLQRAGIARGDVYVTTHPSAILRIGEAGDRDAAMDAFVEDLRRVDSWLSAA